MNWQKWLILFLVGAGGCTANQEAADSKSVKAFGKDSLQGIVNLLPTELGEHLLSDNQVRRERANERANAWFKENIPKDGLALSAPLKLVFVKSEKDRTGKKRDAFADIHFGTVQLGDAEWKVILHDGTHDSYDRSRNVSTFCLRKLSDDAAEKFCDLADSIVVVRGKVSAVELSENTQEIRFVVGNTSINEWKCDP